MTPKTTWTSADHNDVDARVSVVEAIANGDSLSFINGVTAWAIGDSLTKDGSTSPTGAAGYILGESSHFPWACHLSDARMRFLGFGATAGYTTSDVIANWLAGAIAARPGICFVLAGTNDVGGSIPLATTITNLTTIYTSLRAVGTVPILCTIPPRTSVSGFQKGVSDLNAWIRRYATLRGLVCVDYHSVLADPTTGAYLAAYDSGDGVHPNALGAYMMAQEALGRVLPLLPSVAPDLVAYAADAGLLVSNALFQTDSGSGLPSQWGLGSGSGATLTLAADPAVKGNAWTIARGAADLSYFTNPRPAVNVGDRIRVSLLAKWMPAASGVCTIQVLDYPSNNVLFCPVNGWTTAFGWHVLTGEFTVANAGTTNVWGNVQVKTGAGSKLSVAQFTLRNLTAEGVA